MGDFTSQIFGNLGTQIKAGSFCDVYRCTIQSFGGITEVAVKVFKTDSRRTMEKFEKAMLRELEVWLRLKHSTIVPLLGTTRVAESPLLALVSQWMPSGTLYEYLGKQATIITPSARIELAKGIAEGLLNYLHSENLVHGDLHPGNVLIDGSGNPCLMDFGLATVVGDAELQWSTTTAGRSFDSRWRAPEVIGIDADPGRPTFKSDAHSFGSVMFFIISGDVPWKKKNSYQICVELSRRVTPARPHGIFDNHWKLIQKCWSWKPGHRPGTTTLLYWVQSTTEYPQWIANDLTSQQSLHSTASATTPTRLWRSPQSLHYPCVPHNHVSYPTSHALPAQHTHTPAVTSTRSWAPTGKASQQYRRAAFTGPISQSHVSTQHNPPLAPSYHGQLTWATSSELADLVSLGCGLDESWASLDSEDNAW
ncbi:kinase-like protein [Rhizopogon salebrosus TDB-379]|nr:kinase-like protein [Rhizopogon salebrosus TDB-379]